MSVKVKDVLDALQQMQKSLECSICLELLKDPHSTKCNHQFCGQCIKQVLEKSSKKSKNKWYCPLCKTPVSKRSLTPNPKLNEIVAAVRNLQGAVQEDTGIPTGSPPPQPFKPCSTAGTLEGAPPSSTHHPTHQKCLNNNKATKKRVSKQNQFNVYNDNDENNILDNKQCQVVSNVNIRSTIGPTLIQTTTSSTKPDKPSNIKTSRRTRNSRRIVQKIDPDETLNEKNVRQELLHMIDIMPFQPVSKGVVGPTCETQGDAVLTDEPKSNKAAPSHESLLPTKTASKVNNRTPGSEEKCPNASVQQERSSCLTTIAEADSSIRTCPRDNAPFCTKNDPLPLCVNTTNDKEYEGVVSSTKFDSCPLSSLDTMQSVSILPSQDCCEQQCDVALDNLHDEDHEKSTHKVESARSQDIEADGLISTESCLTKNQEESFVVCKKQEINEQSIDTRLPSDDMTGTTKDPSTQSLDFDALVPFFDYSSLAKPTEALQKAEEKAAETNSHFSELGDEKHSPGNKGRDLEDALNHETAETDLCERVKQRQRRRASEMTLQSNRRSDPPKKSLQLKTKTKKRSADSVAVSTHNEPSPDGNARKKFKKSRGPSTDSASPLTENKERRSQESSELSSKCKENEECLDVNGSSISSVEDNDLVKDDAVILESRSWSSDKTMLSNEMVPASVSSSEKSISPLINPMIAHANQALEGLKEGFTVITDGWDSQKKREPEHGNLAKPRALQKPGANEESPQIKPAWNKGKLREHEPTMKEKAFQDQGSDTKETTFGVSSSKQISSMTSSWVDASKQSVSPKGREGESLHVKVVDSGSSSQASVTSHQESQPFDSSDKELLTVSDQSSQFHKELEEQKFGSVDIDNSQGSRSESTTPQASDPKQKHLEGSSNRRSQKEIPLGEKGMSGSQIVNKLSNGSVEAEGRKSEPLRQDAELSDNTPTQNSLEVMDALTPCLFGNGSWETPVRKTCQKDSGNQQCPNGEANLSSKIAPMISRPFGMSAVAIAEGRIVSKAGFDKMNSLDSSQPEARNAAQKLLSGVSTCLDGNGKELASGTDAEGTQSFGTSQSISVLHDLEFPPQEHQEGGEDDNDTICSKEREDCGNSSQIVYTATNGDAPSIEPLPKKPRSGNAFSSPHKLHSNVSLEQGSGPSVEKTRDSECMESDVIPPTPPVKPVAKQVFISRSPSRVSRSKMKLQRKDETNSHSERLVVKPKRRVKSPRVLKSTKSQDSEGDRAGTGSYSVGSETSEDSISLLKNLFKSPEALDAQTLDFSPATRSDSNQQFDLSEDRNTETSCKWDKMKNAPWNLRRGSTHVAQTSGDAKKRDVSSQKVDEKEKNDSEDSQKERQRVVEKSEERRYADLLGSRLLDVHDVESVHSSPCSSGKQKAYDITDSFDWSGTRDQRKEDRNCQDGFVILSNGATQSDQHVRANIEKDDNDGELTDDLLKKSETGNLHEDDRDCIVVDDGDNRDFPCSGVEGVSNSNSDEGGSSSDEALLKPVFLPKETESSVNDVKSCKDYNENQDEEVAAFSQELIPSEDEGEEEDDGITSSYKALDSTGASTATFLSEAAPSTQKMEVLRQDVEAMEKEMEELRAYLAKTDEKREEGEDTTEDEGMEYQEEDPRDEPDIVPSLTPPPPLTPKSIPPMRQLSSPLKNVSRYLDQEGQSSDEDSDCEDITRTSQEDMAQLRKSSSNQGNRRVAEKEDADKTCTRKRPLSPNYEDDGLSITAVENRQDGTPSPPRSIRSKQNSQEKDEKELIVIDDRDPVHSKTGSLLLVKRRRVADELVPKKSPVVSLLFTRARKDSTRPSQSPRPAEQNKIPSPINKKSTPFIYSRKRSTELSPASGQDSPPPQSRESVTRDSTSRESGSREIVSRDLRRSADPEILKLKVVTNPKMSEEQENENCQGSGTTKQLSFVATRLNRKQLAEARALAETYSGKLASEFNSKTSHVIMATDENMQVTRQSYTMKYLMGLALGKWIVSNHWITACIQAKALVAEADYEVKGDLGLGQTSIPRLARTARNNKGALLFDDFDVLCYGHFGAAVSKEQLGQLLKFCGARVFIDAEILKIIQKDRRSVVVIDKETRNHQDDMNAICRQLNTRPVSLEWVTDSIANYKIQDLRDYIMEF